MRRTSRYIAASSGLTLSGKSDLAIAQVTVKSHQATQVSDASMESVGMSDFQNHCFTRGTEHGSRRSCVYTHYVAPPGRNRKLSSCFSNQFLPLSPTHGTAPWGSTGCTGLHNCLHMMITVYVSSVMFFFGNQFISRYLVRNVELGCQLVFHQCITNRSTPRRRCQTVSESGCVP